MERLQEQYERCYRSLEGSEVVSELFKILDEGQIEDALKIRCLALGSPLQSKAARYQLALLELLAKHLKSATISVFDPVFTELDKYFIAKRGDGSTKYIVEETEEKCETTGKKDTKETNSEVISEKSPSQNSERDHDIFYFLPHAELSLTEEIYHNETPKWVLGNDLTSHTDSFTKKKLFESYPLLAHLRNRLDLNKGQSTVEGKEFQVSRRKRKGVFKEPVLDYNYETFYFENIKLWRLSSHTGPWENAFSDLALHVIEKRH